MEPDNCSTVILKWKNLGKLYWLSNVMVEWFCENSVSGKVNCDDEMVLVELCCHTFFDGILLVQLFRWNSTYVGRYLLVKLCCGTGWWNCFGKTVLLEQWWWNSVD